MKAKRRKIVSIAVLAGFISMGILADVTVTIDESEMVYGFMNVFELPENGGAYVFGSDWGIPDLSATFNASGSVVTMIPNSIEDPNEFWYIGGGGPGAAGNKIMGANVYAQVDGALAGQMVTFKGAVLSNTLTPAHEAVAFIRDFAPGYESFNEVTIPLIEGGSFSIGLDTINDPLRHVQYGIQMEGVNVWATDLEPYGSVVVAAIPEPSSIIMIGLMSGGFCFVRRRLTM